MKKILYLSVASLFVLCVLSVRYFSCFRTFEKGDRLLLPVRVEEIRTDAFSSVVRLRYYNFIPVDALMKESGRIVIRHLNDGRVAFVSKEDGQKLRSRELLLKYTIVPPPLMKRETVEPNIRFASSELRFSKNRKINESAVCYAVAYVNGSGNAFLSGLADCNGAELVKGLTFSDGRTR